MRGNPLARGNRQFGTWYLARIEEKPKKQPLALSNWPLARAGKTAFWAGWLRSVSFSEIGRCGKKSKNPTAEGGCATRVSTGEKAMSKEEIMAAIQGLAQKLGRVPTLTELKTMTPVGRRAVRSHFTTFTNALIACGMLANKKQRIGMDSLFGDWANLARQMQKLPTSIEYEEKGMYSTKAIVTRCGTWKRVPHMMMGYAQERGLVKEWPDVMAMAQYRSLKQKRTLGVTGRWRCLGVTLGRRVMHGTLIQTPAERWPYRGRVGNGEFGANLSYGSGTRDFAAARQSQSAGTRSSGSSDGLLRDGFGNVDGSQLPGGVAVFADGRALVAGG